MRGLFYWRMGPFVGLPEEQMKRTSGEDEEMIKTTLRGLRPPKSAG
jgi:hypothetical protein